MFLKKCHFDMASKSWTSLVVFLILLHTPSFLMEIVLVSDLKNFANSRPSASNFKSFSRSLEQFFLTVGQNNFGNKIPFLKLVLYIKWQVLDLQINYIKDKLNWAFDKKNRINFTLKKEFFKNTIFILQPRVFTFLHHNLS